MPCSDHLEIAIGMLEPGCLKHNGHHASAA